jgi:hypothetical protein
MSTERKIAESTQERSPRGRAGRLARRGFLGTLGAGGLTAASSLFGRGQPAYATYKWNCCNLAVYPNISYSSCSSNADYIWYCSVPPLGYLHCDCCESTLGNYQRSAAYCHYS